MTNRALRRGGDRQRDRERGGKGDGGARGTEQAAPGQHAVEHGGREARRRQRQRLVADRGAEPEKQAGAPAGVRRHRSCAPDAICR